MYRCFLNKPNYKYFGRSRNYYAIRKKGPSDIEILSEGRRKPKSPNHFKTLYSNLEKQYSQSTILGKRTRELMEIKGVNKLIVIALKEMPRHYKFSASRLNRKEKVILVRARIDHILFTHKSLFTNKT